MKQRSVPALYVLGAVFGVVTLLTAVVLGTLAASPLPGVRTPAYEDGAAWAQQFKGNGILKEDTCVRLTPGEFDRAEWLRGCREYAASVGVTQR
jgi:hypothetical protein